MPDVIACLVCCPCDRATRIFVVALKASHCVIDGDTAVVVVHICHVLLLELKSVSASYTINEFLAPRRVVADLDRRIGVVREEVGCRSAADQPIVNVSL